MTTEQHLVTVVSRLHGRGMALPSSDIPPPSEGRRRRLRAVKEAFCPLARKVHQYGTWLARNAALQSSLLRFALILGRLHMGGAP